MRRKGEDTFAMKRRRMPFVAKLKLEDPFRSPTGARSRRWSSASQRLARHSPSRALRCGLPAVPLPDLGEGARHAALDRPQRHRAPADANALSGPQSPSATVRSISIATAARPAVVKVIARASATMEGLAFRHVELAQGARPQARRRGRRLQSPSKQAANAGQ
jgi:hypothetical protein